jgi:hypothetical protein
MKGSFLFAYPLFMLDLVEDERQWRPERWEAAEGEKINSVGFYPFGMGLHSCPGRIMANLIIKNFWIQLWKSYVVVLKEDKIPSPGYHDILKISVTNLLDPRRGIGTLHVEDYFVSIARK